MQKNNLVDFIPAFRFEFSVEGSLFTFSSPIVLYIWSFKDG